MKLAILGGTGKQGSGLAVRWARAGHDVTIGSRDGERAAERAAQLSTLAGAAITGSTLTGAIGDASAVVLSVPYAAQAATLAEVAPLLIGRRVLTVVVPLKPPRVATVELPPGLSAALEAQAAAPGAIVAAALHHVSSTDLTGDAALGDVLVCGDDRAWLADACGLIASLGCRALEAGPLRNSIALEAMTSVLLHLNRRYKAHGASLAIVGIEHQARDP